MYTHMYICIHMYTYVYVCLDRFAYTFTHIDIDSNLYVYMHILHACMHVYKIRMMANS